MSLSQSQGDNCALPPPPVGCVSCARLVCVRQQALALALGVEEPTCLDCLGRLMERAPEEILAAVKDYVLRRECLAKLWRRYVTVADCPDSESCLPCLCFAE